MDKDMIRRVKELTPEKLHIGPESLYAQFFVKEIEDYDPKIWELDHKKQAEFLQKAEQELTEIWQRNGAITHGDLCKVFGFDLGGYQTVDNPTILKRW